MEGKIAKMVDAGMTLVFVDGIPHKRPGKILKTALSATSSKRTVFPTPRP